MTPNLDLARELRSVGDRLIVGAASHVNDDGSRGAVFVYDIVLDPRSLTTTLVGCMFALSWRVRRRKSTSFTPRPGEEGNVGRLEYVEVAITEVVKTVSLPFLRTTRAAKLEAWSEVDRFLWGFIVVRFKTAKFL